LQLIPSVLRILAWVATDDDASALLDGLGYGPPATDRRLRLGTPGARSARMRSPRMRGYGRRLPLTGYGLPATALVPTGLRRRAVTDGWAYDWPRTDGRACGMNGPTEAPENNTLEPTRAMARMRPSRLNVVFYELGAGP